MKEKLHTLKDRVFKKKYIGYGLLGAVLIGGIYWFVRPASVVANKYVFTEAKKGNLIISVTGTGQVSPENQIDLKAKASGDLVLLPVKAGSSVKAGSIVARIDTSDAQTGVRDAKASLESAQISYEKFAEQNSEDKLAGNLIKAYDAGFTSLSGVFLDLPKLLDNLEILNTNDALSRSTARLVGGDKGVLYREKAEASYYASSAALTKNMASYRGVTRVSSNSGIDQALSDTYRTTKALADTVKIYKDYVDYLYSESSKQPSYASLQVTLGQYTATINSNLSTLLSSITSIADAKSSYTDTNLGTKSSALVVQERKNALLDAQNKLEDYIVRAPFEGLIAKTSANIGDSISPSTVIATLITRQKIAEVLLNEVDVAKVKVGQKATLTFDAVSDLVVAGDVVEIDLIGTESQGVVSYNVKIAFNTEDERVKPGMSVSASIITDFKQGVLIVPNTAIKTAGSQSYLEIAAEGEALSDATSTKGVSLLSSPQKIDVRVGLSNDESTEVLEGISEGQLVIARIISGTAASAAAKAKTGASGGIPGVSGARPH